MYILHYAPDNASLIIRLALEHRGLPYQTRLVDRATHQQRSAAYLQINPTGLIPALETPQGVIFETGAILLWLAEQHGALAPAPHDADRGDFLKWFMFTANTVHPALRMLFYPEVFVGSDAAAQQALRACQQSQIQAHFAKLDAVAADQTGWFGADAPTILDFYVAAMFRWVALYPMTVERTWFSRADFPNLLSLCKTLEALPCTEALRRSEGMGTDPFTAPDYPHPPEGSPT